MRKLILSIYDCDTEASALLLEDTRAPHLIRLSSYPTKYGLYELSREIDSAAYSNLKSYVQSIVEETTTPPQKRLSNKALNQFRGLEVMDVIVCDNGNISAYTIDWSTGDVYYTSQFCLENERPIL